MPTRKADQPVTVYGAAAGQGSTAGVRPGEPVTRTYSTWKEANDALGDWLIVFSYG